MPAQSAAFGHSPSSGIASRAESTGTSAPNADVRETLHAALPAAAWQATIVSAFNPKLRKSPELLAGLRTPEGTPIPPNTQAELKHGMARLQLIRDQIIEVEKARFARLHVAPRTERSAQVRLLCRVVGIGIETADMLVHEVLWRKLRDRRAVARYAGLTGAPDQSGEKMLRKGSRQGW